MSKKQSASNRAARRAPKTPATTPAWEVDRRRETARMLDQSRAALALIEAGYKARRELQDRDVARAREIHAELQAWVDGGAFPERAHLFGRLHALVESYAQVVQLDQADAERRNDAAKALDEISGATLEGYVDDDEREDIEGVMVKALRCACGFIPESELERGKAA